MRTVPAGCGFSGGAGAQISDVGEVTPTAPATTNKLEKITAPQPAPMRRPQLRRGLNGMAGNMPEDDDPALKPAKQILRFN
jgi:hypothetical protein